MKKLSIFRSPPRGRRPSKQRGFSLIEVLISVLLLSLGVLGLIGLQARAMSMSGEAEDRNRAALLADEAASQMWLRHTVTLSSAVVTEWKNMVQNQLPNGVGTIDAVNAESVDVTITWRSPAQTDDSTLHTRIIISADPAATP